LPAAPTRASIPTLTNLRHAVEIDRFGIVAHVLRFRDGCKADQCGAFALFNNASHVSANLAQRTYDFYVLRHAANWPAVAQTPVASLSPPPTVAALPPAAAAAATGRPLPANYFLPSAASIPPINIMTAEPSAPAPRDHGWRGSRLATALRGYPQADRELLRARAGRCRTRCCCRVR